MKTAVQLKLPYLTNALAQQIRIKKNQKKKQQKKKYSRA